MRKSFKTLLIGCAALLVSGGNVLAVELDKMGGVEIHGFISSYSHFWCMQK